MSRLALFLLITWILTLLFSSPQRSYGALSTAEGDTWFIDMSRFSKSAHGSLSCELCHGDMKENGEAHPDLKDRSKLRKNAVDLYDYSKCKVCHRQSYARYLLGEHAKALKKSRFNKEAGKSGIRRAPTCGDCHDAHYERSHLTRVEIGAKMTEVCGLCHLSQKRTYLNDFHGRRAVNLGYEAAAYCSDCHGAHECISLKDKAKALAVCQRCHRKAGLKFTEYVVHPIVKKPKNEEKDKQRRVSIIKTVGSIMAVLVIFVVVFFYGHNFLWLLRELHEKLRKH